MAVAEAPKEAPQKKSKMGLILIALLGVVGIGGGGAAGYMGLIPVSGLFSHSTEEGQQTTASAAEANKKLPDISSLAFVDLDEVIIPLGQQANAHHLVAQFTIETTKDYKGRIEELKPRIVDVMNKYLRAVEETDITDPTKFQRLQALMLNRVQLVAGDQALRNILVQKFILQ